MNAVDKFYGQWQSQAGPHGRDALLARLLGDDESHMPCYCTNIGDAQSAMDRAWLLLEESAPVRIACHVAGQGRDTGGRRCHVEWWPDDGEHYTTPQFESEAESRAFAAFAFLKLEAGQG
ncbi:hypothetical protein [Magnetococcus marinus]|nr:hypothetical protein [Magnetococcus marinus]